MYCYRKPFLGTILCLHRWLQHIHHQLAKWNIQTKKFFCEKIVLMTEIFSGPKWASKWRLLVHELNKYCMVANHWSVIFSISEGFPQISSEISPTYILSKYLLVPHILNKYWYILLNKFCMVANHWLYIEQIFVHMVEQILYGC